MTSYLIKKTRYIRHIYICKQCFISFKNKPHKFKLSGQAALNEHKLICGSPKPILPVMSAESTVLEFEDWSKMHRHSIVILYTDFEALFIKTSGTKGKNTVIIQKL